MPLLLFLALPHASSAQVGATTDILSGRVLGSEGEPLAGATVAAISLETEVRHSTLADSLQATNDDARTAVQRQMQAGIAGADPGEGFRALQPQLQRARTARQEALHEAQRILTPEQWERVPAETRNPPQIGEGRMRRPQG